MTADKILHIHKYEPLLALMGLKKFENYCY